MLVASGTVKLLMLVDLPCWADFQGFIRGSEFREDKQAAMLIVDGR